MQNVKTIMQNEKAISEEVAGQNSMAESAPRPLTPEAARALSEAQARRAAASVAGHSAPSAREINGRPGLEPVRYGDWEVKGIASDF